MSLDKWFLLAGSTSNQLTHKISDQTGIRQIEGRVERKADDTIHVELMCDVVDKNVIVVQSIIDPVNANLMELLFWVRELKACHAHRVHWCIPYFGVYHDATKLLPYARVLRMSGLSKIIKAEDGNDLRSVFSVPIQEFRVMSVIYEEMRVTLPPDTVLIASHLGLSEIAGHCAAFLNLPLAIGSVKSVVHDDYNELIEVIGEIYRKPVLLLLDQETSAARIGNWVEFLSANEIDQAYLLFVHGLLNNEVIELLENTSLVRRVFAMDISNGVSAEVHGKFHLLSISDAIALNLLQEHGGFE
jgi:ribose-phosphate pyrophosphokinase